VKKLSSQMGKLFCQNKKETFTFGEERCLKQCAILKRSR
jgi:hypothetical protein